MASKTIICLTGMPGSGKSTVADILKKKGFAVVELSEPLRKLMEIFGFKLNVRDRELFRAKLKREFGIDILAILSSSEILGPKSNVVVSGVRNTTEIETIRAMDPQVVVIAVTVPKRTRYERLIKRKDAFSIHTYGEFEERDRTNIALGILTASRAADYVVSNIGTIRQLRSDINELLREIRKQEARAAAGARHRKALNAKARKGKLTICLTGMPGSGKSTVANMLRRRGFAMVENSAQTKKLMRMYGMHVDAKNMEPFVVKIKSAFGRDIMAKLSSKKIVSLKGDVVVSGPRDPAEVAYIKSVMPGAIVIAVSAPGKLRYNRLMKRKDGVAVHSYREFEWRDSRNVALGTRQSMNSADYVLINTGTKKQLSSDLDDLIAALRKRRKNKD